MSGVPSVSISTGLSLLAGIWIVTSLLLSRRALPTGWVHLSSPLLPRIPYDQAPQRAQARARWPSPRRTRAPLPPRHLGRLPRGVLRGRLRSPASPRLLKESVDEYRCARCGASAAPRATHAAHVAEPRIASACGPRHWRPAPHRSDRPFVNRLLWRKRRLGRER